MRRFHLVKPVAMGRRHIVRDALFPLCRSLERRLGYRHKDKAQMFLQLQHRVFGLTDTEWRFLRIYLSCNEAMAVAVQRQGWLTDECLRLENNATDFSEDDPAMVELAFAWVAIYEEMARNRETCEQTRILLRDAERGLTHTPLHRGLYDTRRWKSWYQSRWYTARCAESGGCCGRSCQCCRRPRDHHYKDWLSHCTPACACCLKHYGIDKPIDALDCPQGLPFSVDPAKSDSFSERVMDALIWNRLD